jgi:hypothetical protein
LTILVLRWASCCWGVLVGGKRGTTGDYIAGNLMLFRHPFVLRRKRLGASRLSPPDRGGHDVCQDSNINVRQPRFVLALSAQRPAEGNNLSRVSLLVRVLGLRRSLTVCDFCWTSRSTPRQSPFWAWRNLSAKTTAFRFCGGWPYSLYHPLSRPSSTPNRNSISFGHSCAR